MEKIETEQSLPNIAKNIADSLTLKGYNNVLEIGPGMGVLTKYLFKKNINDRPL